MILVMRVAWGWSLRTNRLQRQQCMKSLTTSFSGQLSSNGFRRKRVEVAAGTRAFTSLPQKYQQQLHQNPDGLDFPPSKFVHHILIGAEEAPVTVMDAIQTALGRTPLSISDEDIHMPQDPEAVLDPLQLLHIGAIHFLPSGASQDRSKGIKAVRLTAANATTTLQAGDYLRIHHSPRRFPAVYDFDWGALIVNETVNNNDPDTRASTSTTPVQVKPGVMVKVDEDKGYIVIDKPASVPVHPTVDNVLENIPHCIRQAKIKKRIQTGMEISEEDLYVASPQRLDQNTSGLMVVATTKSFAAYFAKLLRDRTDEQLERPDANDRTVQKKYRCLVCMIQPSNSRAAVAENDLWVNDGEPWSIERAMKQLRRLVEGQIIVRHYLEPSIRAPKRFAVSPGNETWAECLLRITNVGEVCRLTGDPGSRQLALKLWGEMERIPPDCVAVVELEVALLTGRTHQIRGQLSTVGFPLVGDAQYGGSIPCLEGRSSHISVSSNYMVADRLALQCCELSFLDPDFRTHRNGTKEGVKSDRWNSFRLGKAWWTPLLSHFQSIDAANTQADDNPINGFDESSQLARVELLPPKVQLALGRHKYVLVKAFDPRHDRAKTDSSDVHWFVRSASVTECGGPYHADVARDLVEWIEAAGFKAIVTGGGRAEYTESPKPQALVYGFSYGFGKGDHAKAAAIIREETRNAIDASFDNSVDLY